MIRSRSVTHPRLTERGGAQHFLTHALNCPTDHPARECPNMIAALDRLVDGEPVERLVDEHR
jgi:hypothetical protein